MKDIKILMTLSLAISCLASCGGNKPSDIASESVTQESSSNISSETSTNSDNITSSNDSTSVHEHTFSLEWSYDEAYHWHAATCEHTDLVNDKEEHTWEDTTDKDVPATFSSTGKDYKRCSVCGYETYTEIPTLKYQRIDKEGNEKVDGNYVLFGEYPQTIKADDITITSDVANENGYYLGSDNEYYAKLTANPYNASSYTFSNGTKITKDEEYYFKVEPIKWRILTEADGTALLFSESILYLQSYQSIIEDNGYGTYYNKSEGVPEETYANNYQYSEIRYSLNNGFYNTAFIDDEKEIIEETNVDNSSESYIGKYSEYFCENTNDKVFLLAYAEVNNSEYGFSSKEDRVKYETDYARCQGVKANYWWLRTPSSAFSNYAVYANVDKDVSYTCSVRETNVGAAPALNIKL